MKKTFSLKFLMSMLLLLVGMNAWAEDLSVDFESATTAYTDWTFTNMTSQQTTITANSGTYHGTTGGCATASIVTKEKIANPGT